MDTAKKGIFALLVIACCAPLAFGQTSGQKFTKQTDDFLKKYTSKGSVNYKAVKANFSEIEGLYVLAGNVDMSKCTANGTKAFYINAYNVAVIYQIAKVYPVGSPMDKAGFFDKIKHKVAGESLTLNGLEKEKLLKPFKDARVHFAVVCAAKGCPQIGSFAFTGANLEAQLNAQTKKALNRKYFVRVDNEKKKVGVSKIFEWYASDFTQGGQTVLGYINKFRSEKIPNDYKVSYYEYDWKLNSL